MPVAKLRASCSPGRWVRVDRFRNLGTIIDWTSDPEPLGADQSRRWRRTAKMKIYLPEFDRLHRRGLARG